MGRIRTIKPEFWEDEKVGILSREARLLMLATLNMADDEGLLRWTPAYIKASAFMYDSDVDQIRVEKVMRELTDAEIIFPYNGGVSQQPLAFIVNFRRHQRINRPQPGKLPPPSLQNLSVKTMYAQRDNWTCSLCGFLISNPPTLNDSLNLSLDHILHQSAGGSDYPSNIRATHQACNKGRKDKEDDKFTVPLSISRVNDSLNDSLPERKGREGNGRDTSARSVPPEELAGTLPLVDGSEFPISKSQISDWSLAYPGVDVRIELSKAKEWLKANPTRGKTKRGILRFIVNWLDRSQNRSVINVRPNSNQSNPAKERIDNGRRVLAKIAIERGLVDPTRFDGGFDAPLSGARSR